MVRVKLLCGDRPFQMENASMADAIKAAAKRLNCKEEEVTLKFKEDDIVWEIEGEDTYNSAIADGWIIHAEINKGKQPRKRRRSSGESDHSAASAPITAPAKRIAQTSTPAQTVRTPPGSPSNRAIGTQSRSPASRPINSRPEVQPVRSRTMPLSTQDQMRSSGRAWSDKDKAFLWKKLTEQLRDSPSSGPTYTLEERRDVFNILLQNNAKRFEGRTALVLEGRIQKRVFEMRKAKQRIPADIEALFPRSRLTKARSTSQPSTNRPRSEGQIPKLASAMQRRASNDIAWMQARVNSERLSAPSTSTTSAQHARRRYENDAIRVEALDIPGPSRRRGGLDSLSLTDEPDNDSDVQEFEDDGETGMSDGQSIIEADVYHGSDPSASRQNSRDSFGEVAAADSQRDAEPILDTTRVQSPSTHGTISNDSLFASGSLSSSSYEPTNGSSVKAEYEISPLTPPETPRDIEMRAEAGKSRSTSLAPSVKLEDINVSQVSDMPPSVIASVRADDVRKEVTSALDTILPNISPNSQIKVWAEKLHRKLSALCFVGDPTDNTRFNASEAAYCLSAALDELFRYSYVRSQSVHERRLFIVAIAMLFEALHAKLYFLTGFEVLLCKFFHQILFEGPPNSMRFSAQLIASCSLLIHPFVYDSILDGIFVQPWSKKNCSAQQTTKLSPSETEQVFIRMAELIEGLNVATIAVQQRAASRALAERRTKPIRFSFRSWKRVFEETRCDSNATWRIPPLLQDVRQGMEKWNRLPIALTTRIVTQPESHSSASTSRDSSDVRRAAPVHSSGTDQPPSLHTSPARNTRSNQQSQLFLGLPDFSQSFSHEQSQG
ncbi:uncharacterized protein FA14DRAFT_159824 [Meira miltonrushii]|uniref:Uncharacterized protein n=1 Tax=Meira miltonrushii TaxID=1280837 RepID=A0A316VLX5_9BASI|nr:uncharacterized protein FA14DRAFT_159824 [Meira miltonrushii]PWN38088.1 hypothetical protein FA14DRAFT_159824 [Meira miltonrushii]